MTIKIKQINAGSVLSKAGIQEGDSIARVNIWPVSDADSFKKAVNAGNNDFEVERAGSTTKIEVSGTSFNCEAISESGETFELESSAPQPFATTATAEANAPKAPKRMIMCAWGVFILTILTGLMGMFGASQIDHAFGTQVARFSWISMLTSWLLAGFLVAFAYVMNAIMSAVQNLGNGAR